MITFDLTDRNSIFSELPRGGIGAEIGVGNGGFSKVILRNADPKVLWLIDCWEQQPVAIYGHDPANVCQEDQDARFEKVFRWSMTELGVQVLRAYSAQAAPLFLDEYFDWLYLDANHLQCAQDLRLWWPKIRSGGWMMGHDYVVGGKGDFITVQADVDQFVAEENLSMLLTDDPIYQNYIIQKP